MYAQAALKPNTLLRNDAYGIVMRGVQKCTCAGASLRGRKSLPLCCIKLDTATDVGCGNGAFLAAFKDKMRDASLCGLDLSHEMVMRSRERISGAVIEEGDEGIKKGGTVLINELTGPVWLKNFMNWCF